MNAPPLRTVILGGGTAGWMAACLFKQAWPHAAVTLVESPDLPIVGVGEGSTPQLKHLFDRLGLAEAEWMPRAHATYKVGIAFAGWSGRAGFDRYFHPFATELDRHSEAAHAFNALARRGGADVPVEPDRFFLPARLAAERRAPLPGPAFPFELGYGYHFDAHEVGAVLRDAALRRGVERLVRHVRAVELDGQGAVARLLLVDDTGLAGDLFVDASGFRGLIGQRALGVCFRPFADNLFNDSAVVIPTAPEAGTPPCHTQATALSAGWAWRIPLTHRVGNGYVYSSAFLSAQAAEAELRRHIGPAAAAGEARHLSMRVGRVERSWEANCLSIGLAQGFIEPLEATALHLVQATVEGFIDAYAEGGFGPRHRDRFNAVINARYEGVRDYIVCHYRMTGRQDTAYWRENAANERLSDSLKAVLTAWYTKADLAAEIAAQGIGKYYAPLSWHALLAGYGAFPSRLRAPTAAEAQVDMGRIDRLVAGCALNFPDHGAALGRFVRAAA